MFVCVVLCYVVVFTVFFFLEGKAAVLGCEKKEGAYILYTYIFKPLLLELLDFKNNLVLSKLQQ
jgi:hypothetical protein